MQAPGENPPRECEAASSQLSSPGSTGRSSIPEAVVIEPRSRSVLDTPHARGMTVSGAVALFENGIGEPYGCAEPLRASSVGPLAGTLPGEPITIQITTAIMIAART